MEDLHTYFKTHCKATLIKSVGTGTKTDMYINGTE